VAVGGEASAAEAAERREGRETTSLSSCADFAPESVVTPALEGSEAAAARQSPEVSD